MTLGADTQCMPDSLAALVPMKGHSERVPNKNVREFNGRPLFHWIINTLEATDVVDDIVVNTDSTEIAEGATEYFDVTVIDRPGHLRGDEVPMNDIILHDVAQVEHEQFLQTHCTNPLLRPETITGAIETFHEAACDSLFSVTRLQTRLWDEDCEPVNHERDRLLPTQELAPLYEENSNVYLFTQESVEDRENRIGSNPQMYEMPAEEAVDIDYPIDFRTAEFLHRDEYGDEPTLAEAVA